MPTSVVAPWVHGKGGACVATSYDGVGIEDGVCQLGVPSQDRRHNASEFHTSGSGFGAAYTPTGVPCLFTATGWGKVKFTGCTRVVEIGGERWWDVTYTAPDLSNGGKLEIAKELDWDGPDAIAKLLKGSLGSLTLNTAGSFAAYTALVLLKGVTSDSLGDWVKFEVEAANGRTYMGEKKRPLKKVNYADTDVDVYIYRQDGSSGPYYDTGKLVYYDLYGFAMVGTHAKNPVLGSLPGAVYAFGTFGLAKAVVKDVPATGVFLALSPAELGLAKPTWTADERKGWPGMLGATLLQLGPAGDGLDGRIAIWNADNPCGSLSAGKVEVWAENQKNGIWYKTQTVREKDVVDPDGNVWVTRLFVEDGGQEWLVIDYLVGPRRLNHPRQVMVLGRDWSGIKWPRLRFIGMDTEVSLTMHIEYTKPVPLSGEVTFEARPGMMYYAWLASAGKRVAVEFETNALDMQTYAKRPVL